MNSAPLTVEATLAMPAAKAWAIWTNPDDIVNWNNASDDWHTPHAENDLKAGGRFVYQMAAKDGSFSFDFGGTYTQVQPNHLLEYTLDDGRMVTVAFTEESGKTHVTETFEPEGMNPAEMQQQGWQAILDNFKRYAEER